MINYQRKGAKNNPQVGNDFENLALSYFSKNIPTLRKNFKLRIGIYDQKPHKFDIGCFELKVIIECKSHTWTSGGNVPSAKLATWDQAMLYFYLAPRSYRKIFFAKKDVNRKSKESLCHYYLRTHSHVIPDEVEFFEADEDKGKIEKIDFDLTKEENKCLL